MELAETTIIAHFCVSTRSETIGVFSKVEDILIVGSIALGRTQSSNRTKKDHQLENCGKCPRFLLKFDDFLVFYLPEIIKI